MVKIDYTGRSDRNLESYDSLTAIGLGRIYTDGPLAEYLQEVELKYVDNCNRYFRWPGTITSQSKSSQSLFSWFDVTLEFQALLFTWIITYSRMLNTLLLSLLFNFLYFPLQ